MSVICATTLARKQTFEEAVLKATTESATTGSPRYIHHRADGEFAVLAYSTVGTVAVAEPDGTLKGRSGMGL
jgi:hypothetical protein